MIETSRPGIGFDLTVPGIVKIDLCQLLEKFALLLLIKVLNRIDDFYYSAHGASLLLAFRFVHRVVAYMLVDIDESSISFFRGLSIQCRVVQYV